VRLAVPPAQLTLAGRPDSPGEDENRQELACFTAALSCTFPPPGGSDLTLARKYVTDGRLIAGAAIAGSPGDSTHTAAPAAAAMLNLRLTFMPDILGLAQLRAYSYPSLVNASTARASINRTPRKAAAAIGSPTRRALTVRMAPDGRKLATARITNDLIELRRQIARARRAC